MNWRSSTESVFEFGVIFIIKRFYKNFCARLCGIKLCGRDPHNLTIVVDKNDLRKAESLDESQFVVLMQNLLRLNLVEQVSKGASSPIRGFHGWDSEGHIGLTALGEAFVLACTGPHAAPV